MKSKKRQSQAKQKKSMRAAYHEGGGKSRYALKKKAQAAGVFSDASPFKAIG